MTWTTKYRFKTIEELNKDNMFYNSYKNQKWMLNYLEIEGKELSEFDYYIIPTEKSFLRNRSKLSPKQYWGDIYGYMITKSKVEKRKEFLNN
jgi:hypothetical protein